MSEQPERETMTSRDDAMLRDASTWKRPTRRHQLRARKLLVSTRSRARYNVVTALDGAQRPLATMTAFFVPDEHTREAELAQSFVPSRS